MGSVLAKPELLEIYMKLGKEYDLLKEKEIQLVTWKEIGALK